MDHKFSIDAPEQASDVIMLICATCGQQFKINEWQPSLCCPACKTIGYPDRASIHLLAQAWDCDQCGTTNSGLQNFCMACGTGLASRCLRCEHPVYNARCSQCGTHQAHLQRYQNTQAERTHWQPIIASFAQEQAISAETDGMVRQASPQKSRWRFRLSWGWIWIISGVLLMSIVVAPSVLSSITVPAFSFQLDFDSGSLTDLWVSLRNALQTRLQAIFDLIATLSNIKPGDSAYPLLLGGIVFTVSLFPLLLYFIGRTIKRIFS